MVAVLLLHSVHGDTEQLVRNPRARQYPAPSFTAFTPITKAKPVSQYQPAAPPLNHYEPVATKVELHANKPSAKFQIAERATTRACSWLKAHDIIIMPNRC